MIRGLTKVRVGIQRHPPHDVPCNIDQAAQLGERGASRPAFPKAALIPTSGSAARQGATHRHELVLGRQPIWGEPRRAPHGQGRFLQLIRPPALVRTLPRMLCSYVTYLIRDSL